MELRSYIIVTQLNETSVSKDSCSLVNQTLEMNHLSPRRDIGFHVIYVRSFFFVCKINVTIYLKNNI